MYNMTNFPEMIHYIRTEVIQHADGTAQSDDVTMVCDNISGSIIKVDVMM